MRTQQSDQACARSLRCTTGNSCCVRLRGRRSELRRCGGLFPLEKRSELIDFLGPYRNNALANHPWNSSITGVELSNGSHRVPGGQSRWSQGKDLSWGPFTPQRPLAYLFFPEERGFGRVRVGSSSGSGASSEGRSSSGI
jgi:hypothetical protein